MASKYEMLIGQTINGVYVVDYKREPRTSKTGRTYKVGRLTVSLVSDTSNTITISIDSWRKWSFIKRLNKLTGQTVKQVKKVKQTFELVLGKKAQYEKEKEEYLKRDDFEAFHGCETVAETKRVYKRLAKKYHPDHGGTQEQFRLLQVKYEIHLAVVEVMESIMDEVEEYRKTGVYEGEVY